VRRPAAIFLLLLTAAAAAPLGPGRHLGYAESQNRLVYAFVSGHKDTCRVFRRPAPPRLDLPTLLARPPRADWKGAPGETLVAEFDFGRAGRPVHLVPSDDGEYLVCFANRAPGGGRPADDLVYHLAAKSYADHLDYEAVPVEEAPGWPALDRVLPHREHPEAPPDEAFNYAFLARQPDAGRVLVARRSEGPEGMLLEMVCFEVDLEHERAALPAPETLHELLKEREEGLWRAGAAWALGRHGRREDIPALKAALRHEEDAAARAEFARALVRCGDETGLRTLRGLLEEKDRGARRAAALALAQLPPDRLCADALAVGLADADPETARLCALALARLGGAAVNPVLRLVRSSRPELRIAAARLLGHVDDATAEERLLGLVRDPDPEVALAAAVALTAPPRAILPANHEEFGDALLACARSRNGKAARRLSMLAQQAQLHHERVYEGLVACAPIEEKAIAALARLTGERLLTPDDCAIWWKAHAAGK